MDNRLINVAKIPLANLKQQGLEWLATGENEDYIADAFLKVNQFEVDKYKDAAEELYELMIRAAAIVVAQNRWEELGIPKIAVDLIEYSLHNELSMHLVSRFDFAGGLDGIPIKMLELNADTCSLMPETSVIQEMMVDQEWQKMGESRPYNQLHDSLVRKLSKIKSQFPERDSFLISTGGYEEDWLNTDSILSAAQEAGFADVRQMAMNALIFSPDEGIFMELNSQEFIRFDFWYKFIPWDVICKEETEVFLSLKEIIMNDKAVVLNPAYTMLLQSKGLMRIMHEQNPGHPLLLKSTASAHDFPRNKYVKKPYFGRMGENISYYDGRNSPEYETQGDFAHMKSLYQELAYFNQDSEEHRYQPSIFFTDEPAAMCFRRQDDFILDDDAEFVGHVVG